MMQLNETIIKTQDSKLPQKPEEEKISPQKKDLIYVPKVRIDLNSKDKKIISGVKIQTNLKPNLMIEINGNLT